MAGMTDWMDQELKRQQLEVDQEELAKRRRLHQDEVVKEKGPNLLNQLTEAVAVVVKEYQSRTADNPQKRVDFTEHPSGGFALEKPFYPAGRVNCTLDVEHGIIVSTTVLMLDKSTGRRQHLDFNIAVDQYDEVSIVKDGVSLTLTKAAELLVRPVLFPR
jgi:hypothetical protein